MFKFSKRSKKRMEGVNLKLIEVAEKAILISKVDFGIPREGGVRTASQQHRLFLDGKSNADGLYKKSNHQFGNALDVYAYVDGNASWEVGDLAQIACAFLQASIESDVRIGWGGFWVSFSDMPHFELIES